MELFNTLVSIIIIGLAIVIFSIVAYGVGSMVSASMKVFYREATLVASVNTGGSEYYIEIVWTGPVLPVRYIVLANGELVSPSAPVKCGIGYAPAPYRYCLYEMSLPAQPIGVFEGG